MQARGNPGMLPKELREPAPRIPYGCEQYYNDFLELDSERSLGMSEGPIPYSKIKRYADDRDLTYEEFYDMLLVIREMDSAYLNYRSSEAENSKNSGDSGSVSEQKQIRGFRSKNRK